MENLTLKEFLGILVVSLLLTPIGYAIVFAPPMWWIR